MRYRIVREFAYLNFIVGLLGGQLYSSITYAENATTSQNTKMSLSLASGYSKTNMYLNFYSDGEPNIGPGINLLNKQEVDTRNNEAWQWAGAFRIISNHFYSRFIGNWGDIRQGTAHVQVNQSLSGIPVPGNVLNQIVSFNKNTSGEFYDLSAALGYPFKFLQGKLMISPLIGYSYAEASSHENVLNGTIKEVIETSPIMAKTFDITGGIDNIHSQGKEPFVGVDVDINFNKDWSLYAGYDFHPRKMQIHESGNITAELISPIAEVPSIEMINQDKNFHLRNTQIHNLLVNISYKFTKEFLNKWSVGLSGSYSLLTTSAGQIDETDTSETISSPSPPQTLNEALAIRKLKVEAKSVFLNLTRRL